MAGALICRPSRWGVALEPWQDVLLGRPRKMASRGPVEVRKLQLESADTIAYPMLGDE